MGFNIYFGIDAQSNIGLLPHTASDFLGKERWLNIMAGDLLVVEDAGAYGFVMSSNYNTRPRCAEVMVAGNQAWLVRRRETYQDLLASELNLSKVE